MRRTIELLISPQGETRLQTQGFSGASCRAASAFLEQALGVAVSEQRTAEYYAPAASSQQLEGRAQ